MKEETKLPQLPPLRPSLSSVSFLSKTALFPPPSCSVLTSVTNPTSPPLYSSLSSSSLPFLPEPVLRPRVPVPKIQLQSLMFVWTGGGGAAGGKRGGINRLSVCLSGSRKRTFH